MPERSWKTISIKINFRYFLPTPTNVYLQPPLPLLIMFLSRIHIHCCCERVQILIKHRRGNGKMGKWMEKLKQNRTESRQSTANFGEDSGWLNISIPLNFKGKLKLVLIFEFYFKYETTKTLTVLLHPHLILQLFDFHHFSAFSLSFAFLTSTDAFPHRVYIFLCYFFSMENSIDLLDSYPLFCVVEFHSSFWHFSFRLMLYSVLFVCRYPFGSIIISARNSQCTYRNFKA